MPDAIKYLVVSTAVAEENVDYEKETMGDDDWQWEEEHWNSATLAVEKAFDNYGNAKVMAEKEVFYALVSVYSNE